MSRLLRNQWMFYVAATAMTYMFWWSGITKILDFQGTLGEMAHFKLNPPALFAAATIVVQLGGSALIIFGGRLAWLGAGALALFTLGTIPIAHDFWNMTGQPAMLEKLWVQEHVSVVGGLMLAAILAHVRAERDDAGRR